MKTIEKLTILLYQYFSEANHEILDDNGDSQVDELTIDESELALNSVIIKTESKEFRIKIKEV